MLTEREWLHYLTDPAHSRAAAHCAESDIGTDRGRLVEVTELGPSENGRSFPAK